MYVFRLLSYVLRELLPLSAQNASSYPPTPWHYYRPISPPCLRCCCRRTMNLEMHPQNHLKKWLLRAVDPLIVRLVAGTSRALRACSASNIPAVVTDATNICGLFSKLDPFKTNICVVLLQDTAGRSHHRPCEFCRARRENKPDSETQCFRRKPAFFGERPIWRSRCVDRNLMASNSPIAHLVWGYGAPMRNENQNGIGYCESSGTATISVSQVVCLDGLLRPRNTVRPATSAPARVTSQPGRSTILSQSSSPWRLMFANPG